LSEKEFGNKWTKLLIEQGIKKFPDDFIDDNDAVLLELPKQNLMLGKEFFGSYEILTTSGESVYQAADLNEAKFIIYAGKNRSGKVNLPVSKNEIKSSIKKYEAFIDSILLKVQKDFIQEFQNNQNFASVSNNIFKALNLTRY
jgi:hypothetical protein